MIPTSLEAWTVFSAIDHHHSLSSFLRIVWETHPKLNAVAVLVTDNKILRRKVLKLNVRIAL